MGPLKRLPFWTRALLLAVLLIALGLLVDFEWGFWVGGAVAAWIAVVEWRRERTTE